MKLTKNQKWILGGALVLGAIVLYRRNKANNEQTSSFSRGWGNSRRQSRSTMATRGWQGDVQHAGGYMHCVCTDKWGNTTVNNRCRKSQHADCNSCCNHYGKVSPNESI